jgi:hypothetical protein
MNHGFNDSLQKYSCCATKFYLSKDNVVSVLPVGKISIPRPHLADFSSRVTLLFTVQPGFLAFTERRLKLNEDGKADDRANDANDEQSHPRIDAFCRITLFRRKHWERFQPSSCCLKESCAP